MSDPNQAVLPASFVALYLAPGRSRPIAPREEIAERYEFCDDLAQCLAEPARTQQWELAVTEADVLERIHRGLLEAGSGLDAPEAGWVVCRLAELLDWPMPPWAVRDDAGRS